MKQTMDLQYFGYLSGPSRNLGERVMDERERERERKGTRGIKGLRGVAPVDSGAGRVPLVHPVPASEALPSGNHHPATKEDDWN